MAYRSRPVVIGNYEQIPAHMPELAWENIKVTLTELLDNLLSVSNRSTIGRQQFSNELHSGLISYFTALVQNGHLKCIPPVRIEDSQYPEANLHSSTEDVVKSFDCGGRYIIIIVETAGIPWLNLGTTKEEKDLYYVLNSKISELEEELAQTKSDPLLDLRIRVDKFQLE